MRFLSQKQNGTSFDTADWAEVKDGDRIAVTYWAPLTKDAFLFDDGNEDEAVSYDADGKTTVKTNGPTTPSVVATGPDRVDGEQVLENRDADDRSADSAVLACGAKPFTRRGDARPTTHRLYMAKAREENKDSAGANSYAPLGRARLSMCKAITQAERGKPTDAQKASSAALASGAETQYYEANALSYPNDGTTATQASYGRSSAEWFPSVSAGHAAVPGGSSAIHATSPPGGGAHVIDKAGAELPGTGGTGTAIFCAAGAAAMPVAKRRIGAEA